MSLLSDPDYLIHSLRLSYLRNVDDIYGPRLISLSPSYSSNPYILAASLADSTRWPELDMPSSPPPSDDETEPRSRGANSSGFPGASGLKYTQTIMGPSRSGAMGLRVSGSRRASTSLKRLSHTPRQSLTQNGLSDDVQVPETSGAPPSLSIGERGAAAEPDNWVNIPEKDDMPTPVASQANSNVQPQEAPAPPPKEVQFIPRFKGAAEMEARRKIRMLARQVPAAPELKPPPPVTINPEMSSSDEAEDDMLDDDEDDFDDLPGADDSMDDDDEFDPDFAATRTPGINSDSASEVMSVFSATGSAISTSNSSILGSKDLRNRSRLSPVTEHKSNAPTPHHTSDRSIESFFEMVTPLPSKPEPPSRRRPENTSKPPPRPQYTASASSQDMTFTRRKVAPARPQKSALTSILASSGGSTNPFTELYAAISGRAETSSMNVQVYFPHARQPSGRAMGLNVRKDATVEEVIGFALWSYWEEGWLPKLDGGLSGEDDPKWGIKLSAIGWIMRIAEDDGEVDDDFPPPDRTGRISKFNFDAYAVLEASPEKVAENQLLESKIQRRPSRIMAANKKSEGLVPSGGLLPPSISGPGTSAVFGSTLGSLPLSTSLGPSSSHGPQIFLRIRVAENADAVHISTTIPVSAGMYIQDALELVCEKRKLNPKDYALLLAGDQSILIPLDRTVASLQGQRELMLIKRSMLPQLGIDTVKTTPRTTDPNASIFKRISEVPIVPFSSAVDFTAAYKKYTVYRKMPMLVTRHERTLAIDGQYIHIMPSTNKAKAVFDSGKTSSYHMKSIYVCQQSAKSSSHFKLVVSLDRGHKRYDFEAESPKLATEIVQTIRSLKAALERTSTINKSRRSKHVV